MWIWTVRSAQNDFGLIGVTSVDWVMYFLFLIFFYIYLDSLQRDCCPSSYIILIRKRKAEKTLAELHKQGWKPKGQASQNQKNMGQPILSWIQFSFHSFLSIKYEWWIVNISYPKFLYGSFCWSECTLV